MQSWKPLLPLSSQPQPNQTFENAGAKASAFFTQLHCQSSFSALVGHVGDFAQFGGKHSHSLPGDASAIIIFVDAHSDHAAASGCLIADQIVFAKTLGQYGPRLQ